MSEAPRRISSKFYSGVWGIMGRFFKVPREAPSLPTHPGETVDSIKPSRGYLNRMRVQFFIGLTFTTIAILVGAFALSFADEIGQVLSILSLPIALLLEVVFAMFGYLAIHLKYDTMWYVMNNRSIRLRRGIWLIRETTITFENIQNVSVHQGPIQRLFGISNLLIETAGGGGAVDPSTGAQSTHQGLIEGVADPHRIREMIMARLRQSKSAGLGDEEDHEHAGSGSTRFNPRHVELLREVRDAARELANA